MLVLDPSPPRASTPRKRRSKPGLSDEDAERLFAAQQAARAQVAAKLGKRVGSSKLLPGLRKAMDKAFERIPDVEGLIAAMEYRGRTDKTQQEYRWLGGPSAWNGIDHAYGNRDDTGGSVPVSSDGFLIDTTRT